MSPERWRRIDHLLQAALDLPVDQRAAFVKAECGDDDDLRFHVEEALAAMEQPDADPFRTAIGDVAARFIGEAPLSSGLRLGAYRLIEEIGRGGMGSVYLAQRDDDEFRKQVAIKVVKRGMDTDHLLRRFRQERRILARLEHPNIARILDAGSTADGLPYLVMEYVQGAPIDEYCRSRNLSLAERLQLFRQVCAAVEYAHRNLVVHRDLKPGNILVDGSGSPRLLDFGIAKLIETDTDDVVMTLTADSARLMTPRYASPEQVRDEPITTASDIYSLGTILYELLTGAPAHRITSLTPASLVEAICEREPATPSVAARAGDPPTPPHRLAGDLDNILLMALRKEPRERYASVEQFSADLQRFLEYRPVHARPRTVGYRVAKYIRRNFATVIAASIAVVLLVALTGVSVFQARRAERRFLQVRKLANAFLFDIHDQLEGIPGTTKAKEAAVRTALEYLDGLARDSGGDSELLWELASAFQRVGDVQGYSIRPNLGQPRAALESHRKALDIAKRIVARDPSPRNEKLLAQGYQRIGYLLLALGNGEASRASLLEGLAAAEHLAASRPDDADAVQILARLNSDLAEWERFAGNSAGAMERTLRSIEVNRRWFERHPGENGRSGLATGLSRGSQALADTGDLEGALEYARQNIAIREELMAAHPNDSNHKRQLMNAYEQFAAVLFHGDRLSLEDRTAAAAPYRKVLKMAEELFEADPNNVGAASDLVIARRNACLALAELQAREALSISRAGLELMDRAAGIRKTYRGLLLSSAAVALRTLGRVDEARVSLERAIEVQTPLAAQDPLLVAPRQELLRSHALLGGVLLDMSRREAALQHLEQARNTADELLANRPSELLRRHDAADAYESMACYYRSRRDCSEARRWYGKSLDIWTGWTRFARPTRMDEAHRDRVRKSMAGCAP